MIYRHLLAETQLFTEGSQIVKKARLSDKQSADGLGTASLDNVYVASQKFYVWNTILGFSTAVNKEYGQNLG